MSPGEARAVDSFAHECMVGFARAVKAARPGSNADRARATLGERFLDVAIVALRRNALRQLLDPAFAEQIQTCGALAIRAAITATVADTLRDVIAESERAA